MQLQLLDSYRSFSGCSDSAWVAREMASVEGWGSGAQKHWADILISKLKEDQKL